MKKTFILAENYSQAFFHFAHKMKSLEYIYIQSPTQLQGLGRVYDPKDFSVHKKAVEIEIIKVGTWYNRDQAELNEIHLLLTSYGHDGILASPFWIPDSDILNKLDKLLQKSSNVDNNTFDEACKLREVYTKYGYIQKRRANELWTFCINRPNRPDVSNIKKRKMELIENIVV